MNDRRADDVIHAMAYLRGADGRWLRLTMALLAFIGSQVGMARAAFRPTMRRVATASHSPAALASVGELQTPGSAELSPTVDAGRLPRNATRRGAHVAGPSIPADRDAATSADGPRRNHVPNRMNWPPGFVPPPPFHPPRASWV